MGGSVRRRYEAAIAASELQPDEAQLGLADALDAVLRSLAAADQKSKKSALGWLFARGERPESAKGLYIWGGVGRGKTLLMDMFFAAASRDAKRRVHFHEFMGEVHDRLNVFRGKLKSGEVRGDDPIPPVAAEIAEGAQLLCFDEFSVNDIADAMILGRLFEHLFAHGVTIVTTSNVAPDDLYKDGLNRALFMPFIALLKQRMDIFHLGGGRDYRLDSGAAAPLYVTPLGPQAAATLAAHFRQLTGCERGKRRDLAFKGRRIAVPEAADGVARFAFADLCARPLSARDFLSVAANFHTLIVADIPVLGPAERNEAKRFINLVDTLYDNRIRLIASAAAEPDALWQGEGGAESFEFARTASRLNEMRSEGYWAGAGPASVSAQSA